MTEPVTFLNDLLARTEARDGTAFEWGQIVSEMNALADVHTPEAHDLLVRLVAPGPDIPLAAGSAIPHLMAPRDMLRMLAIQMLPEEQLAVVQPHLDTIVSSEISSPLQAMARRRMRVPQ